MVPASTIGTRRPGQRLLRAPRPTLFVVVTLVARSLPSRRACPTSSRSPDPSVPAPSRRRPRPDADGRARAEPRSDSRARSTSTPDGCGRTRPTPPTPPRPDASDAPDPRPTRTQRPHPDRHPSRALPRHTRPDTPSRHPRPTSRPTRRPRPVADRSGRHPADHPRLDRGRRSPGEPAQRGHPGRLVGGRCRGRGVRRRDPARRMGS